MVAAYAAARAAAPGHLMLYRVGEFYEVLGDDAATVSRLLGIQLTVQKRGEKVIRCRRDINIWLLIELYGGRRVRPK